MKSNAKIRICKLSAAKRQMVTAIKLYFNNEDCVSIHALASASLDILDDLNRNRNYKSVIDVIEELTISPKGILAFRKRRNAIRNFLKHADRDPNGFVEYNINVTDMMLWEAQYKYRELTQERDIYLDIYLAWFVQNNQEFFNIPPELKNFTVENQKKYGKADRKRFFVESIQLLAETALFSQ